MVASIVGHDLVKQKDEELKELSEYERGIDEDEELQTKQIEHFRVFECGHSYHRRCIDNMQEGNNFTDSDSENDENFFNRKRETRMTLYQLHKLNEARQRKIKCVKCMRVSLRPEDFKP